MNILITGGAGFIGSAIGRRLSEEGHNIGILDNFSNSYKENVPKGAILYEADITKPYHWKNYGNSFKSAFIDRELVIHCAAMAGVDESPENCMMVNVLGGTNVLEEMRRNGIKRIINASSAAVYGIHEGSIKESTPCNPINDYGLSKLLFEIVMKTYRMRYGIEYTNFRYFNVVGPGENRVKETHLIPNMINSVFGYPVSIYGDTHPTKDGTCIRDYIHVSDVADAHLLAIEQDIKGTFNIGSGKGYTVKQIIGKVAKILGKDIYYATLPARSADPPSLVANIHKARQVLGFKPRHTLASMIQDQWEWRNREQGR